MVASVKPEPLSPPARCFRRFTHLARSRVVRSMLQFFEEELVIPEGRYRGTRWRAATQPYAALLVREMDNPRWRRFAITGCVQSGKSLIGFVGVIMYYLFETVEPVIVGVPTVDEVGKDKWENEIKPAIAASRYAKYLPTEGAGARGGFPSHGEIRLKNGARLKFMSGSGGDEKRSSYTARVVVCTEVDKFDTAGESSREADPITQLESRTMSYPESERRIYLECTVSIPDGRIWKEVTNGSDSRLVAPCPHCGEHVFVDREHLVGWEQAENALRAGQSAHFACPECGAVISDRERIGMNRNLQVLHKGQQIGTGGAIGDYPETYTLGFRWNGFNNLFWRAGELGAKEWSAREEEIGDDQEKWLQQFAWARPWEPPEWDLKPLEFTIVRKRFSSEQRWGKGVVPDDTEVLTGGIDIGKRFGHWMVKAWRPEGMSQVVDYGTFEIPSDAMDVKRAIPAALEELRDEVFSAGWPAGTGDVWTCRQVLVDTGYEPDAVHMFLRQPPCGAIFRGCLGRGESQHDKRYRSYRHPKKVTSDIVLVGEQYYVVHDLERAAWRIEINVDDWKMFEFERIQTPNSEPGAMVWYWSTDRNEHITLAKHYTAEHPEETFEVGKGRIIKWHKKKRDNHYLDCGVYASVAGHICGVRVGRRETKPAGTPETGVVGTVITTPDGRPFLATER